MNLYDEYKAGDYVIVNTPGPDIINWQKGVKIIEIQGTVCEYMFSNGNPMISTSGSIIRRMSKSEMEAFKKLEDINKYNL